MVTLVGSVASLLHLYYTTLLWICQEVFEKKLQFFSIFSSKAPRSNGYYLFCSPQALATIPVGEFPFRRANRLCFAPLTTLLTLLLYHKSGDLSRGFSKVFEKFFRALQGDFSPLTLRIFHFGNGDVSTVCCPRLLTLIVYHKPSHLSIGF